MSKDKQKKLEERLADIEHQRWADWQRYMFSKCKQNIDGSLVIPVELVSSWGTQVELSYSELSENEKDRDRKQVMRYWPIISDLIDETEKQSQQEMKEEQYSWLSNYPKNDSKKGKIVREFLNNFYLNKTK